MITISCSPLEQRYTNWVSKASAFFQFCDWRTLRELPKTMEFRIHVYTIEDKICVCINLKDIKEIVKRTQQVRNRGLLESIYTTIIPPYLGIFVNLAYFCHIFTTYACF